MASNIPTRRSTRMTRVSALAGDENANPPTTRSRVIKAIGGGATAATTASLAKRAATSRIGTAKPVTTGLDKGKSRLEDVAATRKRAALGEVAPNKSSNHVPTLASISGKGAKEVEKKVVVPTRPTVTRRPTRASTAAAENAEAKNEVETRPAPKRRVPNAADDIAPVASTSRSRIAIKPSIARDTIQPSRPATKRSHPPPEADELDHDEDEDDGVYEPASKRIRTSDAVIPEIDELDDGGERIEVECYKIPLASTAVASAPPEPRSALGGPDDVQDWDDLDAEDMKDPQMVTEYVHDILKYMKVLEIKTMPNPEYMDHQPNVQWKMRGILMDWLVEVHHKFRLLPETLFLATNIVDRFLSARVVSLERLQLVGLTCLFIAAKYEEVVCPSVTNFLYMAEGGYTDEEILQAERYVLSSLDFDLSYPNPIHFLRRISKADNYDIQTRTVAKCLMEIACVDHKLIAVTPSLLSAAAVWVARYALERDEWNPNLTKYSGFTEQELLPTAQIMIDYILTPSPHEMFEKKWSSKKYMKAIVFLRDWAEGNIACWPDTGKPGGRVLDVLIQRRGPLAMDLEKEERICGRGLCKHD